MSEVEKDVCDKCKSKIINGECDCGLWFNIDEQPDLTMFMERAIIAYNRENIDYPLTGTHHTGTCIIVFKGDIELCEKLKKFLENKSL